LSLTIMFTIGCDDNDDEAGATSVAFDITRIDVKSTGDSDVSQPELVRFVSSTEGVIVNSKTNSLDFFWYFWYRPNNGYSISNIN